MRINIYRLLSVFIIAASLSSCGEYQRAQKSTDPNYKFEFAKRAFEQKKYVQAATILEEIAPVFKGHERAEETLYLLAMSNYENRDYDTTPAIPKANMPSSHVFTADTDII